MQTRFSFSCCEWQLWTTIYPRFWTHRPRMFCNKMYVRSDRRGCGWSVGERTARVWSSGFNCYVFHLIYLVINQRRHVVDRNVKPHKSAGNQGERMPSSVYRNGARPHSGGGHMMSGLVRRDNHVMPAHNHLTNTRIEPPNCRGPPDGIGKDQGPRRVGYRSRRRNKGADEEEEVKQRQHPSQTPAKEVHSQQPPGGSSCDSGGGVSAPGNSVVHQPAKFELESTSFPPLPGFTVSLCILLIWFPPLPGFTVSPICLVNVVYMYLYCYLISADASAWLSITLSQFSAKKS